MSEQLDAVIIGTGQAGKPLAGALAEAGWKTAIIERGRVGGTCLIAGCTPTKTMIGSARIAYLARRASVYGVGARDVSVDMNAVRERKRAVVDSFSAASERGMRRHETLELIFGEARFAGTNLIEVQLRDGGARTLSAPHIFINTGARPRVPAIRGIEDVPFLDSTSIIELDEIPQHLVILGGGFVGLEFAQMFRRFGAAVTIVEQASRIAGDEDDDISDALAAILEEDGIALRLGATAEQLSQQRVGGVVVHLSGDSMPVLASHLLVAVGRTPNTDTLNLDAVGVDTDDRGYIRVSDRLETSVPGIYALGDVNGGPPFTHVAYDDYRVIRANLLEEGKGRTTTDRMLPYTMFTDPELGRIGLTERQAREQGHRIRIARLPMSHVARAIEVSETRGMMKAIVAADTGRILGAAALGLAGGEMAAVLQVAMMGRLPYTALREVVFAHPTLAEALNNLFMNLSD
jgi:pyruvate/2-oxoglutarate dehydrogenase complex dihydrolipoamide dehydrogenase (E3) component